MAKHINIVSFNVPYPPNYGGIIDVFYKIKALKNLGVKIILHCFEYEQRSSNASELENLCEKVFYYKRKTGLQSNLSHLPYNVKSRNCQELLNNLLTNDYPILFEGLHTCFFAQDKRLSSRLKICRMTNIEHEYYWSLAKAEHNFLNKCFFAIESLKFFRYQQILKDIDYILTVSETDQQYYLSHYPTDKVLFIPCFHGNDKLTSRSGSSDFVLYHAKLSVPENLIAAEYLVKEIFSKLNRKCIIAGMNPPQRLYKLVEKYNNISIIANPDNEEMNNLIATAHVNFLITFQATGMKLKLINALFAGRHILVNSTMVKGTGLENLCHIADTDEDMITKCNELFNKDFNQEDITTREKMLFPQFSNEMQAQRIADLTN